MANEITTYAQCSMHLLVADRHMPTVDQEFTSGALESSDCHRGPTADSSLTVTRGGPLAVARPAVLRFDC